MENKTNIISEYFENFIQKENIFLDKRILQSQHIPTTIIHRNEQIKTITQILAPVLRLERPSNIFIYGKTGTGKTVSVKKIITEIDLLAKKQNLPIKTFYINCKLKKVADTEYRLIAQLARLFKKKVPITGLPTDEVYDILFDTIDKEKQIIIFVLDEIDQLIKKTGDELIYNLTRINTELKKAQLSIIGISNDLGFANNLDPRVKSSLSEEEILFPPYNALQLQQILKDRSNKAFKEGIIKEGVIQKCSALAAREHGDARRALELLRIAGELAERNNNTTIELKHIDLAQQKIEKDSFYELIKTQPKQQQLVTYTIMLLNNNKKNKPLFTGDIYDGYLSLCKKVNLRPLTQRRISDMLSELDLTGIINTKVISKGRFGRTREIKLTIPDHFIEEINNMLIKELGF